MQLQKNMISMQQNMWSYLPIYIFIVVLVLAFWLVIHLRGRARKRKEHQLTHYDALTGLPNWEHMKEEIQTRGTSGALAVFEIKYFKAYNELMGYGVGDKILKEISARLQQVQQQYNIVAARLQSASFVLLCPALEKEELSQMLTSLLLELRPPEEEVKWNVQFACGAAYLKPGYGAKVALENANYARKAAADDSGTQVIVFDDETHRDLVESFSDTGQLRPDAGMGELVVAYQPRYDLQKGPVLVGAEALIRWQHPQRGLLLPAEFLPALEQTGNIKSVDNFVLRQTLWQIKDWLAQGLRPRPVSLNLAKVQFSDPGFARHMVEVAAEYKVLPRYIQFEMNEDAFEYDEALTLRLMAQLREAGFLVSLDDFGKGASSLTLLRKMPLDMLNLDSSLLENIETDPAQQKLLHDIVQVADDLGVVTLIKGVETQAQARIAQAAGCRFVQGFYFGRPASAEEFEALIRPKM